MGHKFKTSWIWATSLHMLYFTKQVCCPSWIWATNLSPISWRKRTKRLGYYCGTSLWCFSTYIWAHKTMYVDAWGSAGKQRWTCDRLCPIYRFFLPRVSFFFLFLFSAPERAVIWASVFWPCRVLYPLGNSFTCGELASHENALK
jgi:hypothetical protein